MNRKGTKKSRNSKSSIQSPKFILAAVWQGNFERNVGWEKLELNLPSKTHNYNLLNRKLWTEKELRKVEIQNLASKVQSSFLQLFKKETLKGTNWTRRDWKGKEKENTFWASWSRLDIFYLGGPRISIYWGEKPCVFEKKNNLRNWILSTPGWPYIYIYYIVLYI